MKWQPMQNFFATAIILAVALNIIAIGLMLSAHEKYIRVRTEEMRFSRYCKEHPATSTCTHTYNGQFK